MVTKEYVKGDRMFIASAVTAYNPPQTALTDRVHSNEGDNILKDVVRVSYEDDEL